MRRWLSRLLCALGSHDLAFALDDDGPFLSCGSCGYRSPGFMATPARRVLRWWRFQRRVG